MGGANFEYAKTADIRERIMGDDGKEDDDEENSEEVRKKAKKERIGNDLDQVDIGPGFQV